MKMRLNTIEFGSARVTRRPEGDITSKNQTSGLWRCLVLAAGILSCQAVLPMPAVAQTTQRPIGDFVAAQGTFCLSDHNGGCVLFQPPVPNYLAWTAPPPPANASGWCGSVDYAGVADRWLVSQGRASLGTQFTGTVTESRLDDGRAKVMVLLHTSNALSWVVDNLACDTGSPSSAVLFGHLAPDVLNGATAALGSSFLQFVFKNTAPGDPLPDLIQLAFAPKTGQEIVFIGFVAEADGPLRAPFGVVDGTPGRATITQKGIIKLPTQNKATTDSFPAETVDLKEIGK